MDVDLGLDGRAAMSDPDWQADLALSIAGPGSRNSRSGPSPSIGSAGGSTAARPGPVCGGSSIGSTGSRSGSPRR